MMVTLPKLMPALNERQAEAIQLRFFTTRKVPNKKGDVPADGYTLAELGKHLGVSRERARQVQERGLRLLRNQLKGWDKSALVS